MVEKSTSDGDNTFNRWPWSLFLRDGDDAGKVPVHVEAVLKGNGCVTLTRIPDRFPAEPELCVA